MWKVSLHHSPRYARTERERERERVRERESSYLFCCCLHCFSTNSTTVWWLKMSDGVTHGLQTSYLILWQRQTSVPPQSPDWVQKDLPLRRQILGDVTKLDFIYSFFSLAESEKIEKNPFFLLGRRKVIPS